MTLQRSKPVPAKLATNPNQINTESLIEAVDEVMMNATESNVSLLTEASRHIISAGGKRIRPRAMLLTYTALGGDDLEHVLPVAAAVELVHTASVVHDDINDHGVMRRGRPSVNKLYGRTFALLTGDFMFTKVYELMADFTGSEETYGQANKILSDATVALVEGETLQAAAVKENNLSREVYTRIIALKTAELFRAATELGALLADANDDIRQEMGQFGFNIGMAFQIVDDILDIIGDSEQLGKTAGIDGDQGKGFGNVQQTADNTADPMQKIREAAMSGDMIERGLQQARHFVDMALQNLEVLPEGQAKQELDRIAQQVIERTY